MKVEDILRYYSMDFVRSEILSYCVKRWVAVEAKEDDKRIFFRYMWRNGPPLSFVDEDSFQHFIDRHKGVNIRSFYASINVYNRLDKQDDVGNIDNIFKCTPIWDIDGSLNNVKLTLDVAKVILDFLDSKNVSKSVYLKWSGRGLHIHLHENAISSDVLSKIHPLDIAYAIVEYAINECLDEIRSIVSKASNLDREFKVENKVDIQRVFTCPLSLHRDYDIVAVCFKPDELDDFDICWTNPESIKHNKDWRIYVEGEADELALEAYNRVGGYIVKMGKKTKASGGDLKLLSIVRDIPRIRGGIGRFQVMALLQAARYYVLKGDLDRAKSFGLNRAIFYAWAKYYKPKYGFSRRDKFGIGSEDKYSFESLGDERVPVSSDGRYIIGGVKQSSKDFDREVAIKINSVVPFDLAWEAALDYVKRFSKSVLESQQEFYKRVYEPVRDSFVNIVQEYLAFKKLKGDGRI
ncbi:MAG: hypothetical protein QW743_04480 [Candidatus Methanomethylicia archaeon]